MTQNDDDLRNRFREFAAEDAAEAPDVSPVLDAPTIVNARRPSYFPRQFALVGGSVVVAATALTIGLVWGTNTGYASARVEGERRRGERTASAISVARELAGLRVNLARTRAELSRAVGAGTMAQTSFAAAEGELRGMEASVLRVERDLTQNREDSAAQPPSPLPNLPMKRALAITCGALALSPSVAPAQQGVPIVDLAPGSVKTPETFGAVLGVRQLSNGSVLVNDAGRRQVKLFDSAFTLLNVALDSAPGSANSYGSRQIPLVRYLGDSSISADFNSRTLLVLGPSGQIARAMAVPSPELPGALLRGFSGIDDKGRLLFKGNPPPPPGVFGRPRSSATEGMAMGYNVDSVAIVRADLDTRRVDTVGRLKDQAPTMMVRDIVGGPTRFTVEPAPVVDEWAILSDGSIALVRGRDYHIDWINADGATHSTPKLPFDWKRLTDDDKQKLIDSTRLAESATLANALARRPARGDSPDAGTASGRAGRGSGGGGGDEGPLLRPLPQVEYVPPTLKDIADYYPSIRRGAAIPDLDGNLWILPTSSAQSKQGELVYDVVNVKGDFYRVRMPVGRSIAGFGKGGVVYLMSGDKTHGFSLERTKVPPRPKTTSR
ncbi:MAG: hypothetical protein ABJF01_23825 [bacterium]